MTSKIKVDNINKVSDDSTIIKKCGSTTTVGSGSGNTVVVCGSTVTIGRCGGSVALASGASQTGFGRTGTVDWQTSIKTGDFTAVSGEGYFVNTTSGAITVTLPSSPSAGAIVAVKDYANTADTNSITIGRNGSNIDGTAGDPVIANEGGSIVLVYADATKGWLVVEAAQKSDIAFPAFIVATGGTITTCGNDKIHTFTGPGTFTVCSVGNPAGSTTVDYLIVAGGGGMGYGYGGAGGAGGYRASGYGPSPLQATAITVSAQGYPIVVGGGGAGGPIMPVGPYSPASKGVASSAFSLTSEGGGFGASTPSSSNGGPGGSGGGAGGGGGGGTGGTGNTPPVSPPQGNNGESGPAPEGHQGGGAGAAGASPRAGVTGVSNAINGTSTKYACGGRSGQGTPNAMVPRSNSGFGGKCQGVAGCSGVVIVRYKFQ